MLSRGVPNFFVFWIYSQKTKIIYQTTKPTTLFA